MATTFNPWDKGWKKISKKSIENGNGKMRVYVPELQENEQLMSLLEKNKEKEKPRHYDFPTRNSFPKKHYT